MIGSVLSTQTSGAVPITTGGADTRSCGQHCRERMSSAAAGSDSVVVAFTALGQAISALQLVVQSLPQNRSGGGLAQTMTAQSTMPMANVAATALPTGAPSDGASRGSDAPDPATSPAPASRMKLTKIGPNQRVPGTDLMTDAKGNLTVTTPGVTIEGIDLAGSISVKASNVTIKNSWIRGPKDGQTLKTGLISSLDAGVRNLLIEGCVLRTDENVVVADGIVGHDFTARNNDISRTSDGIGVFNTHGPNANAVIEGNYIHDLAWFQNDPVNKPEGSHDDGIAVSGGNNIVIRNNRVDTRHSSTIGHVSSPQWSPYGMGGILLLNNVSTISNVLIDGNHISGGTSTIHLLGKQPGDLTNITVSNNINEQDQRPANQRLQILLSGHVGNIAGLETNRLGSGQLVVDAPNGGIRRYAV